MLETEIQRRVRESTMTAIHASARRSREATHFDLPCARDGRPVARHQVSLSHRGTTAAHDCRKLEIFSARSLACFAGFRHATGPVPLWAGEKSERNPPFRTCIEDPSTPPFDRESRENSRSVGACVNTDSISLNIDLRSNGMTMHNDEPVVTFVLKKWLANPAQVRLALLA